MNAIVVNIDSIVISYRSCTSIIYHLAFQNSDMGQVI